MAFNSYYGNIKRITWTKKVKSNEKLIMDVQNEVDIIRHSLKNILTELKKLNNCGSPSSQKIKYDYGRGKIIESVSVFFKNDPSEGPSGMFPSNFASR